MNRIINFRSRQKKSRWGYAIPSAFASGSIFWDRSHMQVTTVPNFTTLAWTAHLRIFMDLTNWDAESRLWSLDAGDQGFWSWLKFFTFDCHNYLRLCLFKFKWMIHQVAFLHLTFTLLYVYHHKFVEVIILWKTVISYRLMGEKDIQTDKQTYSSSKIYIKRLHKYVYM